MNPTINYFKIQVKSRRVSERELRAFLDKIRKVPNLTPEDEAEINCLVETVRGKSNPSTQPVSIKADPACLGEPFHNPYTFIPFEKPNRERMEPTPLTIDEKPEEKEKRFTGILDLEVQLLSPLLTNSPIPVSVDRNEHKTYEILKIGNDVVLPATGVRGALRSLMTILTSGSLGYVDPEVWLCQGRDANLGPSINSNDGKPKKVFLARVVRLGGENRPGTVHVCNEERQLIDIVELAKAIAKMENRPLPHVQHPPQPGAPKHLAVDYGKYLRELNDRYIKEYRPKTSEEEKKKSEERIRLFAIIKGNKIVAVSRAKEPIPGYDWEIKLSGKPIQYGKKRPKEEGAFKVSEGNPIELGSDFWVAYRGRNRHGVHPALKEGDLVWLEPRNPDCQQIKSADDVESIQWARWGRRGERLLDVLKERHANQLPDYFVGDGKVDMVTDLFGQVPLSNGQGEDKTRAFAARIRCGNLIFRDCANSIKPEGVTLAPLSQPHPGCSGFYRQWSAPNNPELSADKISNRGFGLRGFKVYRTTQECGEQGPWNDKVQQVNHGERKLDRKSKTADMLFPPAQGELRGRIRLVLRALSQREVALVLAACAVDWRLGGGKPFGLGHCRVRKAVLRRFLNSGELKDKDELKRDTAAIPDLSEPYRAECDEFLKKRMALWQATQTPVKKLRYPLAAEKSQRGGHVWFNRHVTPNKTNSGECASGLQPLHVEAGSPLEKKTGVKLEIRAQLLPIFDPVEPESDKLFGYDLEARLEDIVKHKNQNHYRDLRPRH